MSAWSASVVARSGSIAPGHDVPDGIEWLPFVGLALLVLAIVSAIASRPAGLMAHARRLATAPPSAEVFTHDGVPHLALRLGACCRVYRWADRPGSKCAFCPILSRDERLARYLEPEDDEPALAPT